VCVNADNKHVQRLFAISDYVR